MTPLHCAGALTWQYLRAMPLVALLVGVLGIAALAFYWPQSAQLRKRWRWFLPSVRLLALAALAVSLLQPVITRSPKPSEMGTVVIVVDHSHGMGIVDQQRKPAQWVALADGLGRLPPGVRTSGDEFNRAIRAARDKLDEATTAQSRLTFAAISGRSTIDAAAQFAAALPRLDSSVGRLTAARSSLDAKSPMAIALENLNKQIHRAREGKQIDAWLAGVRGSLDAVAGAAEVFQASADQSLYNNNARVRAICAELRGLSRFGLVDMAIAHPGTGLLANLPRGMPLYGFALGEEVTPLPLRAAGRPVRRLLLDTESSGGDLAAGIRSALDNLGGVSIDAVVLFSDGRRQPAKAPARSPSVGVPVYAVSVAPPTASQDWSLSHVSVPEGVYAGEPFHVRARVHGVGMKAGAQVTVHCTLGEAAPMQTSAAATGAATQAAPRELLSRRVTLGADLSAEVDFDVTIDRNGAQRLALRLPELPGEISTENNVIERWIKVYPRKFNAALLANAPSWDYRALRDALGSRSGVQLHAESIEDRCSLTADQLIRQDVVVLFDLSAESLDAAQWGAVRSLASERSGTVVLVAGSEHLPAEYQREPLAALLPYWIEQGQAATQPASNDDAKSAWRTWQGEEPIFRFTPVPDAHGGLRLARGENAWASLPPLYRYFALPQLKPVARPLLAERESGNPVITEMAFGAGRVVFVGLDEIWRWRHKIGPEAVESIWLQLLRDRAEQPYAASAGRLFLDVAKAAVAPGEAIGVRVKLVDGTGSPARLASAELRVLQNGSPVRTQLISEEDATAGRCAGTLMGLPAGNYMLEARAEGESVQYPLHVVRQYETELEDASGDRQALERIVNASGGRLLSLEQLRELPSLLTSVASEARPIALQLWDSSYLFAFVVACFSVEWAARKRLGLA